MATERQSLLLEDVKSRKLDGNRLSLQIPAPGESRVSVSSPVRRSHTKTINRRSTWFGRAFDAVGNNGVIDKLLFIKATHDIEVKKHCSMLLRFILIEIQNPSMPSFIF